MKHDTETNSDSPADKMFEDTSSSFLRAAAAGNISDLRWYKYDLKYTKVMNRYATMILKAPPELAELAVQDTFIQLYRTPTRIHRPPNGKFRYVLVAILKNKLGNLIKKYKRENDNWNEFIGNLNPDDLYPNKSDFDADARRAVKDYLAQDLIDALLARGLDELDVNHLDVEKWYLYDPERRNLSELAREFGKDADTVKSAAERVNVYLEDSCSRLFIPLAR